MKNAQDRAFHRLQRLSLKGQGNIFFAAANVGDTIFLVLVYPNRGHYLGLNFLPMCVYINPVFLRLQLRSLLFLLATTHALFSLERNVFTVRAWQTKFRGSKQPNKLQLPFDFKQT